MNHGSKVLVPATLSLALGLALVGPAHAVFPDGKPSNHVWTVPGVIKKNGMTTTFVCTNLGTTTADIGVQIFDEEGVPLNDFSVPPAPGSCNGAVLDIPPQGTRSIATSATAQLHEDCIVSMGSIDNGSARIFSSSKAIACNALVLDRENSVDDPTTGLPTGLSPSAVSLKVIKATKQSGD